MNRVLSVLLLVSISLPVHAGEVIAEGTRSVTWDGLPGDYVFRGGYWVDSAGLTYTRELLPYTVNRLVGGCYTACTVNKWTYTRVIVAPAVVAVPTLPPPPAYTPGSKDWMNGGTAWLTERDNIAGYLQFIKVAGAGFPIDQGPVSFGTVNTRLGYSSGAYNLGSYGANATTLWTYGANREGYNLSTSDAAKVYDQTNLGILFQALGRTTDQAQQLSGKAHDNLSDVAKTASEANSRAAEIIAKGIAASEALRAARGPNVQQSVTTQGSAQSGVNVAPPPPMPPADPGSQSSATPSSGADLIAWQVLSAARCGKCHGGENPKGKFSIGDFPALPDADRAVVFERIAGDADPSVRMPKDAAPLTPAERSLFYRVRGTTTASK